jgi:hypothetical protein
MPIHPDPLGEHHKKNKDMQEVVSKKDEERSSKEKKRRCLTPFRAMETFLSSSRYAVKYLSY